ncbi:oxidoreductase [Actinorhabdospora filicis]|uniref:Oxidoreductase n=2 Tax=Actinorhabdospora filicis TaxID=1785913 RepID=A0A9W6SJY1_9ACTN|nr:oxidoreductase [Actinorhabdospora filicis]
MLTKHRDLLDRALQAIGERGYWSAYPESPSPRVYGETAADEGKARFESYLGADFPLDQPGSQGVVATERSPYGIALDVRYPRADAGALVAAARAAQPAWRDAGPAVRAGVCLEILAKLSADSFTMANAVQFTTGQGFMMAFQAGAPHALDRALEAIAYAYSEMTRTPGTAHWEKPQGKHDPLVLTKTFHVVPRGVALVIGCNTFPTWNSYPGLFASLVTGNPVIVKPHPGAVLPLAITVRHAREVLAEAGFDPNLVTLAAEDPGDKVASALAVDPAVRIVDFTGGTAYGDWLEENARQAQVYTEKAGVNTVIIDSTDDLKGLARNLGFTLALYSGQMCTTTQNILIPAGGIDTPEGKVSFEEVAGAITASVAKLTGDAARAVDLTGAIVNDAVLDRLARAEKLGEVLLASQPLEHPVYPDAVVRTPLIVKLSAGDSDVYGEEWFGPIAFIVATADTAESIRIFRDVVSARGALTAGVYSTSEEVLDEVERAAQDVYTHLSVNLTGGVFVNQSAAFSDFHASGGNPAANSALTDGAYVANRFRVVQSRRHTAREEA